jgi:leucyl aminopeptidase
MLAKLEQQTAPLTAATLSRTSHVLIILPKAKVLSDSIPGSDMLKAMLRRRDMKVEELAKTPLASNLAHGGAAAWVMLEAGKSRFEQQTALRKAMQLLLDESPRSISISLHGSEAENKMWAEVAVYCAWVNGVQLPSRKKEAKEKPLEKIVVHGAPPRDFRTLKAQAEANTLVREFTVLPPNELTPAIYRKRVADLAKQFGWRHEEFELKKLRKMGAGAFVAVAQGSADEDAAIVKLSYRPKAASKNLALVGKGICFDTGGHNLKPARYMQGMHEDMNGSAVALGILYAASRAKLPIGIDCWMAIAQNHISPRAYKQNEIVKALNGTTIEIVHTDAEGRMILADALALAVREKPELVVDFATLTGAMHVALGDRYSGVLSNRDDLLEKAVAAGRESGERVCAFPLDDDYDEALKSKVADVKQCTMDSNADHILAARFLQRFVDDVPWLHMDLSASSCEKGLGAVASDVTGFGVGWGLAFVNKFTS